MKNIRRVSLAVLAGALLLSLWGPSNVFATGSSSLCKKNEGPCSAANLYPAGTITNWATATAAPTELTTKASGTIKCGSTMQTKTLEATGSSGLTGEITSLNWNECKLGTESCTVTSSSFVPFTSSMTKTGSNTGDLTITAKSGGSPWGFTFVCGAFINCTYSSTGVVMRINGGEVGKADLVAEKIALTATGKACPASTWDGTYFLTEPNSVFISS